MKKSIFNGMASLVLPLGAYGGMTTASVYQPHQRSYLRAGLTSGMLVDTTSISVQENSSSAQMTRTQEPVMTQGEPVRQLIIIDSAVPDKQVFYRAAKPGIEIVEIDSSRSGFEQLVEALGHHKNLAALHIVSHARPGTVLLGNSEITAEQLEREVQLFAALNGSIADGGDLLLYGCDLAAGQSGEEFLDIIRTSTHLDVAASNDLTGNEEQGGNWDLEVKRGEIETDLAFTQKALMEFPFVLAPTTFRSSEMADVYGAVSLTKVTDDRVIFSGPDGYISNFPVSGPDGAMTGSYRAGTGYLSYIGARLQVAANPANTSTFELHQLELCVDSGASGTPSVELIITGYNSANNSVGSENVNVTTARCFDGAMDAAQTLDLSASFGSNYDLRRFVISYQDPAPNDRYFAFRSVTLDDIKALDTAPPSVSSINRVTNAQTNATNVDYTVTFSENVIGVDASDFTLTATGTASGFIASVTPVSASSNYTVAVNSISGDGTLRLDLKNAGTGIADSAGNAITTGFTTGEIYTVDQTAPAAPSTPDLTAASDTGSSSTDNITNDTTPAFSGIAEANSTVTVISSLSGTLGTTTANGAGNWLFTAGATVSGTHSIMATATDAAGNISATSPGLSITIDTTAPTASVVVANTALAAGETSPVTITFSEPATGFTNADLTIANGTLSAVSSSDGGITWTATLTPADNTTDATNVITLNNAGVADAAGNAGTGTTNSNNYDVATDAPGVTSVSTITGDGTYKIGDSIVLVVNFSEAVFLSTGTIQLMLETGPTDRAASYLAGSGSSSIYFSYTVQAGDTAADLDYTGTTGLVANSDNIQSGTFIDAILTLPAPGAAGSLGNAADLEVDGVRPTASIGVADTALSLGETSLVTITFSEAVTGFTNADLTIANGTLSPVSSGDGGVTWTATLTPTDGISDGTNVITLTNNSVVDAAGNAGIDTTDSNNYAIDTSAPTVLNVGVPASTTYIAGQNLDFTVNTDENVTVNTTGGIPQITLTVGATLRQARYVSGSGTSALMFRYTVQAGDEDTDGIALAAAIDASGGTLRDAAANDLVLALNSVGNTGDVRVDTVAPVGHSVSFDEDSLNSVEATSASFTFAAAEDGTNYSYTISSSGGGTPVTGTGTIAGAGEQVSGIDLSGLSDGTLSLSVVLTDSAGNAAAAVTDTASLDATAPQPTLATTAGDPATAPFEVTVSFPEPVTGFTVGDITVTNAALGDFSGSGANYSVSVTPTADGTVTVDVSAAVAKDAAGNDNTAAQQLSLDYDGTVPVPTITSGEAGSAVNGPVDMTLDFGEVVSGFVVGDLLVTNASLGGFADLGNGLFEVAVTGSGDGEVTLAIPAGVAEDAAGNSNEASDVFTFTYDSSGPILQSSTPANGDTDVPYDSGLVLVFDEPLVADSGQLTLRDLTEGQDHSVLSIDDARVTVEDKQVTVALDEPLVPTHEYALRVDADSLLDEAGNGWAGIQDDTTLRFTAGNLAPEAGNDSATLSQDTRLALDVLANDVDEEGRLNPASVRVVTAPAHGRVEVETATGAVTYQPEAGYTGTDSFTYVVEDEFGGASNVATVSLTVEPAGLSPVTRGDTATVAPGGTVTLAILDNDRAGATDVALDPQSVELVRRPHHGTAVWTNGELTYTADDGFEGVERLVYTVADADGVRSAATPLFINVSDGGTASVARDDSVATQTSTALSVEVLANDEAIGSALASATVELGRLPGHGVAEVDSDTGYILYTPDADFRGEDVFHYTVRDDRGLVSDTASVTVSVGLTGAPLARNDQVQTLGDATLAINVLGNDRGLDRALDVATLGLVAGPAQGHVSLDIAAGLFRYTPDESFSGSDSFTYTIRDEGGQLSAPAMVTITDQPGNNRPLANDRHLAVVEDSDASISPLTNDQDLNGHLAPASLQVRQQPLNGTLTSGGDGTVSYTPAEDFYGEDRFSYTVADDTGRESELAVIRLVVAPVADKPLINGTPQTTVPAGTAYRFTPTATDIDGNPLTFSVTNLPAWASFDETNGRLQGTPDLEQVGASEPVVITASNGDEESSLPAFRIQVTDNAGGSDDGGDDTASSPVQPGDDETSDRQLVDPADPVLDAPESGWPTYTDEQPSRARYDIDYVDAHGVPRNVSVILDDPTAPLPATSNDGNGGQTLTFRQSDGSEQVVRIDPTGGAEVSSFLQGGDAEPGSRLISQARSLVVTSLPQGGMRSEADFGDEGPGQTKVVIIQSPTGEVTVASVYTGADGNDLTTAVAFEPVPANLTLAADGTVTATSGAVGSQDDAAQEYRITPRGESSILSRRDDLSGGVLSSAIAVRSAGSTGVVADDGYTMVDLPVGVTSQVAEITASGRVQYQDSSHPVDLAPGSAIALDGDGVQVVTRNADPDRNGLGRAAEVLSGAGGSQNLARIEITDVESGNENLRVEEADDGDGFEVSQTLPDGGGVLSSRIRLDGSSQHRLGGRSGQSDNEMLARLPVNLSIRFADRVVAVADSGDAALLAELLASGEVRHEVAVNGESTRASSRISGTRTVMEQGPDGSPQITTRSAAEGRTMTVVADSQGRARHSLVNRAGTESRAEFNAPGASTTIGEDGTIRARSRLGDGDRCAWAETFGNGETGTGFGYYDSDAVRCIGIDAPTSLDSLFEPGASVTVDDDENGASITVETPLTRPLRF